tara:strand:- start:953 stop:2875 length:1923 start_codon:yes stop_codon:yes gene_type:complete
MDSQKFMELYKNKGPKGVAKGSRSRPWAGATGIYMVAPSCPANFYDGESCTNPVPKNVKIGKATGKGGLASRLGSYSTYWPHGTTVHAVMITPSYDEKYGTIRDYASARETTLKRILRRPEVDALGFGSNGKGGKNGSEKVVNSEWVRMEPSELIRYFDAVGPKRHPGDRLYTCNSNQCLEVPARSAASETRQTRARAAARARGVPPPSAANWKALEAVLKNEATLGIPGRPVVLTKAARLAAMQSDHPFHKWAAQLVTNQTKEEQLAQRRLQDRADYRQNKAEKERKEKLKGVLSRAATRRIEKEYQKYKRARARLPRDLAAVQNTVAFRYAPKQTIPTRPRSSRTIPTRPRPIRTRGEVERAKVKDDFAFDTLGVHLRAAISAAVSPPTNRAYTNQRFHYDRARTTARKRADWPMDNERLPLKLENDIYANETNLPPPNASQKAPQKPPQKACALVSRVIKQYSNYTHHDVTGDGRCYFYAILKALGMQLTREKGAVADLERFFKNNYYFNPRNKRILQRQVRNGTFGNPEMVINYSPAIRKLLWDRNVRYIATIQKTQNKPNAVNEYIQDPLRHLVQLSKLYGPSTSYRLQTLTADQYPSHKKAYINATANKQVITFVHKDYPVGSEHFTVIIPRYL